MTQGTAFRPYWSKRIWRQIGMANKKKKQHFEEEKRIKEELEEFKDEDLDLDELEEDSDEYE